MKEKFRGTASRLVSFFAGFVTLFTGDLLVSVFSDPEDPQPPMEVGFGLAFIAMAVLILAYAFFSKKLNRRWFILGAATLVGVYFVMGLFAEPIDSM